MMMTLNEIIQLLEQDLDEGCIAFINSSTEWRKDIVAGLSNETRRRLNNLLAYEYSNSDDPLGLKNDDAD